MAKRKPTKLTVSIDRDVAEILDGIAFLYGFTGRSPRASMVRATISELARAEYAKDKNLRDLVDTVRASRAESERRHPSRRLRLVQGGAS